MKKLNFKWLGILALLTLVVPIITLAANPVLDSANLYKVANKNVSANWENTVNASPGQTINYMVHIHNGNIDTTANGVHVKTTLPTGVVSNYTSTATVSATNAPTITGTTNVNLSASATLVYVPGSTVMYNHLNQVEANLPDGITTTGITALDTLKGCWEYERWIIYKVNVVAVPVKPTCSISADPASIEKGSSAILNFSSTEATTGTLTGFGNVGTSGTRTVKPATNTTYTYSVSGPGGTAECNTTVVVTTKPIPPKPIDPPVITGKGNEPLPTSGPAEAAAGAAGLTATGGAAYAWMRSKKALLSALTKVK